MPPLALQVGEWAWGCDGDSWVVLELGTARCAALSLLFAQALLPEDLRPVLSVAPVPGQEVERAAAAGGFLLL